MGYFNSNCTTRVADHTGRHTSYAYDDSGHLTTYTDAAGTQTTYSWSGANMAAVNDPRYLAGETSRPKVTNGRGITKRYEYDYRDGEDEDGGYHISASGGDGGGAAVSLRRPLPSFVGTQTLAAGTAIEQVIRSTQNGDTGLLESTTDALGRTARYERNDDGTIKRIRYPEGHPEQVTISLTWAAHDRIASITDALGRTTHFSYDGKGNLTKVTNPLGHSVQASYDTQGQLTALSDALGSTTRLTDDNGATIVNYSYDPYGGTRADAQTDNPFQYTGRENDGTGLYYYRARYYSPQYQRFISEDPIGLDGGINVYAYVEGNPVSYTDPLGLWTWGDPLLQWMVDGAVGFGDGVFKVITFGGDLQDVRDFFGIDGCVDKSSGAYRYSKYAGYAVGAFTVAATVGKTINKVTKGYGITIKKFSAFYSLPSTGGMTWLNITFKSGRFATQTGQWGVGKKPFYKQLYLKLPGRTNIHWPWGRA